MMRFLRGFSFLSFVASLSFVIFQEVEIGKTANLSSPNEEGTKIGLVETFKTLQKLKNLRKQMENDNLDDWEEIEVKPRVPAAVVKKEEEPKDSKEPQVEEVPPPSLVINYQPPEKGPQILKLTDPAKFSAIELAKTSLINFELPEGLTGCLYRNPKNVVSACDEVVDLKTLRSVEPSDVGIHRFRFLINETVYEYRFQIVGIR